MSDDFPVRTAGRIALAGPFRFPGITVFFFYIDTADMTAAVRQVCVAASLVIDSIDQSAALGLLPRCMIGNKKDQAPRGFVVQYNFELVILVVLRHPDGSWISYCDI